MFLDSTAWQIAKPLGAIALMGAGVWGFTKLLDAADDAMDRSDERRTSKLRDSTGGSVAERIERVEDIRGSDSHAIRAAVLVRAFDQDGDDRLARSEWQLQSGKDSLDGSRLFSAANYLGSPDGIPSEAVTIDAVEATLGAFTADDDFTEEFSEPEDYGAIGIYNDALAPRSAKDAAAAASRGLFDRDSGRERPIAVAAAEVMARYDASGDGSISREDEATYESGDFRGDATNLLDQTDVNGDGIATFREVRTHLASLDDWSMGQWESTAGSNGALDGKDFLDDGLDSL